MSVSTNVRQTKPIDFGELTIFLTILLGIYLTSFYNFWLFHALIELFSVVVAFSIFLFGWNSRHISHFPFIQFISVAYLFVAGMELLHTLMLLGTNLVTNSDVNPAIQLWLVAWYVESASLFAATWFINRQPNWNVIWGSFIVVVGALLAAIFYFRVFPVVFIEGTGSTPFKTISEYIACLIALAALARLWQKKQRLNPTLLQIMTVSIVAIVISELAFSHYNNIQDRLSLIGHIFKLFSFYFIYRAVITIGLSEPIGLLFYDLRQKQRQLEAQITERTIEIARRQQAEAAIQQRSRQLELLNQAGKAFNASLDLDVVLTRVLEEVRTQMNVVACSVWLIDPKTKDLVCREATAPKRDVVRGWRLAPGTGFVGWVAQHRKSLNIPNALEDSRHFTSIDEQTGLTLRSILSVPLLARQRIVGVLQVVDKQTNRFRKDDVDLLESLATVGAIAIENARLYEQAVKDAQTKLILLKEVNHRVKNNLSALIGLLYMSMEHTTGNSEQRLFQNLVNRVQGLATAHTLLSATEWRPLQLDNLAEQIIYAALRMAPHPQQVAVSVQPSPAKVSPEQAHYLAMIINELTTNVVKHATVNTNSRLEITVSISSRSEWVIFEFKDNGPGFPPEILQHRPESYYIGFELIEHITNKSLDGNLFLENNHGAIARIEFKPETFQAYAE